jgi:hypothetical protein
MDDPPGKRNRRVVSYQAQDSRLKTHDYLSFSLRSTSAGAT